MSSKSCPHTGIDLLIADIPEGLPVPSISSGPSIIPSWNKIDSNCVESIFAFADAFLHDDAALLLFHSFDSTITADIVWWASDFKFDLKKEWWGVQDLRLTSPTDTTSEVLYSITFTIYFLQSTSTYN